MKHPIVSRGWKAVMIIVIAAVMLIPVREIPAGEKGTFSGTWSASGHWRPLQFEEGHEVFTFDLSGHVNLKNEIGSTKDYWSECIGLWDSETGSTARCIWRDVDSNDAAYIVFTGQLVKEGVKVNGTFVGGSGKLKGLTGTLSFTWSSVHRDNTKHILSGFTKDISGTYQIQKSGN